MTQQTINFNAPRVRGSQTSTDAAESIAPAVGTLQARVYEFLKSKADRGATDEEMQLGLDMSPSTQRPRRVELVRKGLVIDSGEKRETKSGRSAVVWKVR